MRALETSFTSSFTDALRGREAEVHGLADEPIPIPMDRWSAAATADDRAVLPWCSGPTLDVGCGPGRMAQALAESGQIALGIDIVEEAVRQTRQRGAPALLRDVFARVPAEGRWETVLLADGNVGIGGDPVALLSRCRSILAPGGRVVVEVAAPGVPTRSVWARLFPTSGGAASRPFRWAVVGTDGIAPCAWAAGFGVQEIRAVGTRWWAVLVR